MRITLCTIQANYHCISNDISRRLSKLRICIFCQKKRKEKNNTENYFGDETRHGTICFPTRQIFGTTFHLVLTFYNLFYLHDKPLLKRQRWNFDVTFFLNFPWYLKLWTMKNLQLWCVELMKRFQTRNVKCRESSQSKHESHLWLQTSGV